MAYQALYRKWRPKTFDEVRGQDAIVTTIKNQIKSGRIGHAYLFCGTRGTGKTSVAKILARAVNCEHTIDGNPCNECDICSNILNDASMNIMEIDAASNTGVDDIREIKEQTMYPPTEGRYKVFIIDEVHMLSTNAFNALLKTLEEPPEYVIFILATTEVHKIPVTVLSRCQRYDFKRISVDTIADRLKELTDSEGIEVEDKALKYIAKTADGAMRDAISMLDECIAFHPNEALTYDRVLEVLGAADTATFAELFSAICKGEAAKALAVVEDAVAEGRELSQFTTDFLWYMRNILIIKSTDDAAGIIDASSENLKTMEANAGDVSRESLMRYIRVFAELVNQMRYSSQKRVLLELAIIKVMTPEMENTADALLERVANIEKKLESGNFASAQAFANAAAGDAFGLNGDFSADSLTTGAAKAVNGPRKIELPKAQYDDLMAVRKEWSAIANSFGGLVSSILKDTTIEPDGDNRMIIVFHDAGTYNLDARDRSVNKVREAINEKFGKVFGFSTRLKVDGEIPTTYVTKEELQSIINMEIEEEN